MENNALIETSKDSAQLQAIAEKVLPGGFNTFFRRLPVPVVLERAKGAYLWDVEGKQYIDYYNGAGPTILGHAHDEVNRKVFEALQGMDIIGVGNSRNEIKVAQKLTQHIPSADMTLLCNGGSDATFHATRLCRCVTGKTEIIKTAGAYHGWHDYLLAIPAGSKPNPGGVLDEVIKHTWTVQVNDLEAIEEVVRKTGNQVAAVFIEPLMHNAGYIPFKPGYLEGLRKFCTDKGIILVFDEVITGFRHGLGGYQGISGVIPDVTTVAKAMANGYTIAAVCGRKDLMEHFNTAPGGQVFFGGTYSGNTGSCAATLATINLLEDGKVYKHIYELGDRLRKGLSEIVQRLDLDAFVTGYGSCWVVFFQKDSEVWNYADLNGPGYDAAKDLRFRVLLIEKGIMITPVARKRGFICGAHTAEDIDRTLDVAEAALAQVKRES